MKAAVNKMVSYYLRYRQKKVDWMLYQAPIAQNKILQQIIKVGKGCIYGYDRHIHDVHDYNEFKEAIPVNTYLDLAPFIREMMLGKQKLLCSDAVHYFAKSSGTSDDKSKYIPVTNKFYSETTSKEIGIWSPLFTTNKRMLKFSIAKTY